VDEDRAHRDAELHGRTRLRLRRGRTCTAEARPADPLARAPPEHHRGARGARRDPRGHPGRPGAARDQGRGARTAPVRRRARREQGPKLDRREVYIVCLRDTTDRKRAEAAIRESEARYRTLVENAPEAIVVLDVDLGRFVECNENAVRFFKMTRDELLASGPEKISPPVQRTAPPSFGVARGYIDRALPARRRASSGCTATRWARDSLRGPPGAAALVLRRLIRGSITDITERKRAEFLAVGERRVFERITGNVDLADTLEAIAETAERVTPDALCAVTLYDEHGTRCARWPGAPAAHYQRTIERVEMGPRATAPARRRCTCSARSSSRRSRATRSGRHCARRRSRPACAPAGPRRSVPPTAACSAPSRCTSTSRAARCAATSS
jgi:PAS domain-containing protein